MVTVSSSHTVVPSEPTPKRRLNLSQIDQIQHLKHELTVYVYQKNQRPSSNTLEKSEILTLRDSLSKILVYYYPMAGRLRRVEANRLEVDSNGSGVMLLEAYSEAKMADYGDFAPTEALSDLIPHIDYNTPIEEWPLLLVQLTRFSCGGLCIGVANSHIVVDGWTAIRFISSWAKLARGYNLDQDEIPFHDRSVLIGSSKGPVFYHREYQAPPSLLVNSHMHTTKADKSTAAILNLTADQVEKLRKKANQGSNKDRPFSRYEAIAAHIWKSACMARQGDTKTNQPTVVRVVASIRNKLKPNVPLNYSGNAILAKWTSVCLFKDILSSPLSYGCEKIREAIESLTNEYSRSAMDWLSLKGIGSEEAEYLYGKPNMNIGSWMKLPVYDADFGWGNPVYMGPAHLNCGKFIIMASPANDGSLLVPLRFEASNMEAFTVPLLLIPCDLPCFLASFVLFFHFPAFLPPKQSHRENPNTFS